MKGEEGMNETSHGRETSTCILVNGAVLRMIRYLHGNREKGEARGDDVLMDFVCGSSSDGRGSRRDGRAPDIFTRSLSATRLNYLLVYRFLAMRGWKAERTEK